MLATSTSWPSMVARPLSPSFLEMEPRRKLDSQMKSATNSSTGW